MRRLLVPTALSVLSAVALPTFAQVPADELRRQLEAQTRELAVLKAALAKQEEALAVLRRSLEARSPTPAPAPQPVAAAVEPPRVATASADAAATAATPQVAPIFEQPGVLTPRGRLTLEPSLQYSYSSNNRVALVGYNVIPAILVGVVDVREVKRNTLTGAISARYGLTNRLEVEAKVPYVYRSDTSIGSELQQSAASGSSVFGAKGQGLGDIEFTARYQLNNGGVDTPYYVGSLRFKTRTGRDPFQAMTSTSVQGFRGDGIQTELPTGSGFYGLQPAITALFPSDPAVFFGTVSYLFSQARHDVVRNTDQGPQVLGTVTPGGILGFNFGMGLAVNEKLSFSIGYDHSSVGKTQLNGLNAADSVRVELGTLLLGWSYRLSDRRSVSVSLGAGLTRDTPDLTLTMRVPTSF